MSFEHRGLAFNLLNMPGHQDDDLRIVRFMSYSVVDKVLSHGWVQAKTGSEYERPGGRLAGSRV
jgi:hypothetical protein